METRAIKSDEAPSPIGPYSQAVLAGNTLYVSGQIAIDPTSGDLVLGDISMEARKVMENLQAVLNEAQMDFSNVVKATIFLKDMDDFNKVNEVYGTFFQKPYPARECVQVARLPKDVNVEISVIAVL